MDYGPAGLDAIRRLEDEAALATLEGFEPSIFTLKG